ncbi:MAG: hypothetical protein D6785_15340, partial [Planctomycetota bacterium]
IQIESALPSSSLKDEKIQKLRNFLQKIDKKFYNLLEQSGLAEEFEEARKALEIDLESTKKGDIASHDGEVSFLIAREAKKEEKREKQKEFFPESEEKKGSPKEEEFTHITIQELIEEIENEVLEIVSENQNEFEFAGNREIELDVPKEALKELLLLLVKYGSKHTYSGKIRILAKEQKGQVLLTVEDNGPIRSAAEMAILMEGSKKKIPSGPIQQILLYAEKIGAILSGKSTAHKTSIHILLKKKGLEEKQEKFSLNNTSPPTGVTHITGSGPAIEPGKSQEETKIQKKKEPISKKRKSKEGESKKKSSSLFKSKKKSKKGNSPSSKKKK